MDAIVKFRSRRRARTAGASVALIVSSLLALAGCGAAHTVEPVGTVPVVVDPLEWNGYWTTPDNTDKCGLGPETGETQCLVVTVLDPAQGLLAIVPEGEAVEPARAYVRAADRPGAVFITLEDWSSDSPVRPLIFLRGMRQVSDSTLVLWWPLPSRFDQLVADGQLPPGAGPPFGQHDGPTIGPLDASEFELLNRTMKWELFDWEDPVIYVRVVPSRHSPPPNR